MESLRSKVTPRVETCSTSRGNIERLSKAKTCGSSSQEPAPSFSTENSELHFRSLCKKLGERRATKDVIGLVNMMVNITVSACVNTDLGFELSNILREEGGLIILLRNIRFSDAARPGTYIDGNYLPVNDERVLQEKLAYVSAQLLSLCWNDRNKEYIILYALEPVTRLASNYVENTRSLWPKWHSRFRRYNSELPSDSTAIGQGALTSNIKTVSAKESPVAADTLHAIFGTEILRLLFEHSEKTCTRMISLGGLRAILHGCRSSNIKTLRHCAEALANLALYGGLNCQRTMIERKAHFWLFPLAFHEDVSIQYYACLAIVVLVANPQIEADVLDSSTLDLVEPFVTSHEPRKLAESTTSHIHSHSASWLKKLIPLLESKRVEARNLACFHFAVEAHIKKAEGKADVFNEIGAVEPLRRVSKSRQIIAAKFACQVLRIIGEKEPLCKLYGCSMPLLTNRDVQEWFGFDNLVQIGARRKNFHLSNINNMLKSCGVTNYYRRMSLSLALQELQIRSVLSGKLEHKKLDVYVSYRHPGSHLASLLAVHLQLRGYSVFIDLDRSKAGKFDNNLLDIIGAARNFILVLSQNTLEPCVGDRDCKDWVHREIAAALSSNCNIIPIFDNFMTFEQLPTAEQLPEDMRSTLSFRSIHWSHEHQDLCMNNFIRSRLNTGPRSTHTVSVFKRPNTLLLADRASR